MRNRNVVLTIIIAVFVIIIYTLYGGYKAKMLVIDGLNATSIRIMNEKIYVTNSSNNIFMATIPKLQAKKIKSLDFQEVDIISYNSIIHDYYSQKLSKIQGIGSFELNKGYRISKINEYVVNKVVISDLFSEHSFIVALLSDGQIITCGDNDYGQLGNGTTVKSSAPVILNLKQNFIDIAVMDRTALAVDSTGALWVWGDNRAGACIIDGADFVLEPHKLDLGEKITAVYSSQMHSFALSESGNIYSWGETVEVLGSDKIVKLPMKINTINNIVMVDTQQLTATALDADGSVFLWGKNYNLGQNYDYNYSPIKIYSSDGVKDISITPIGVAVIENNGVLRFIR